MSDLISRSALIEEFVEATNKGVGKLWHITGIKALIENTPTVEAIPREKLDEIVERLEEEKKNNIDWLTIESLYYDGKVVGLEDAIEICKEVGRTNE